MLWAHPELRATLTIRPGNSIDGQLSPYVARWSDHGCPLPEIHRLTGELRARSIEEEFKRETMALLTTLGDKECDGVKINKKAIYRNRRGWQKDAAALRNAVIKEAGREFDVDSKKEVASVLDERGLLGDGGRRSVTPLQMEQLACRPASTAPQ